MSLDKFQSAGWDVRVKNHADAILQQDFPSQLHELTAISLSTAIDPSLLIEGGGGESKITQELRRKLEKAGWQKHKFQVHKSVDARQVASATHEIDHVNSADVGTLVLEIEWNNKDPFFDRDLENFQRLHQDGAASVGIVITRGASLQDEIPAIFRECALTRGISSPPDLVEAFDVRLTENQQRQISRQEALGMSFVDAWAKTFSSSKFGTATTHWSKLEERVLRGVGNPCPLLLLGIPSSVVVGWSLNKSVNSHTPLVR